MNLDHDGPDHGFTVVVRAEGADIVVAERDEGAALDWLRILGGSAGRHLAGGQDGNQASRGGGLEHVAS